MSIDLATLATTTVTSFLIPYAKVGLEKIYEGLCKKLGENAADAGINTFQTLWNRVRSVFKSSKNEVVWEQFEKRPEAAEPLIIDILTEKLQEDSNLANELHSLTNQTLKSSTETGAQINYADIANILDLRGSDFSNSKNVRITGIDYKK